MTTETFFRRLKEWELAGFINSEVWCDMDDIVDSETIKAGTIFSASHEFRKLTEDDLITIRVLRCVSKYIVTSKRLQFALEVLGINRHHFMAALYNFWSNEGLLNLQVSNNNVFNVFNVFNLLRYTAINCRKVERICTFFETEISKQQNEVMKIHIL